MVSKVSNSMLPPHIVLFGEALRPVLRKVEDQLSTSGRLKDGVESFRDFSERVLGQVSDSVDRLAVQIRALNKQVMRAADTPGPEVHRSVGRLEMVVHELLESYADVRDASASSPTDEQGKRLLLAALRRILTQIRGWLRDLVEATADPMAHLKRKGLPTTGRIKLTLDLHLDDTRELDEFNDWVAEQSKVQKRTNGSGSGLVGFVAGLFLGGLFFGDDE